MKYLKLFVYFLLLLGAAHHMSDKVANYFRPSKARHFYNQKKDMTGFIVSLPEVFASRTSFLFKTTVGLLKVSIYGRTAEKYQLTPGDKWEFKLKLKPIHGLLNPGGFDYKRHLLINGISAKAYVVASPNNHKIGHYWYQSPANLLRYHIKKQLLSISSSPFNGIYLALTIGDRSLLNKKSWGVFQRTGTSHLIAISGLHVGLVFGLIFLAMRFILGLLLAVESRFVAQPSALICAFIGAFLYSALAGFAISTIRALIMLLLLCIFKLKREAFGLGKIFFLTVIITLIINPLSCLAVSFWLSFSAVAALIYGLSGNNNSTTMFSKVKTFFLPQWVIFLCLIPLNVFYFNQISLVSLVANSIAIPVMSFVIIPLDLIAITLLFLCPGAGHGLFLFINILFGWLWQALNWMAGLSYWGILMPKPSFISLCFAVIGVLLLFAPKAIPGRTLSVCYLLGLLFSHPPPPPDGTARIMVLDVGQGLACVIQTHRHVLIYDAGPSYPGGFDAGKSVIIPFLQSYGITQVDKLVISHGDSDHAGGAKSLLNNLPIKTLETSALKSFKAYHPKPCQGNQKWQWDGIQFQYLKHLMHSKNRNDISCVLKISVGKQSILFPGDIEKEGEHYLVVHQRALLPATLLISPHHGSKTSSTPAFLAAVSPKIVLISAGFNNRFHHPSKQVVARYKKRGLTLYNTAKNGAIEVILSEKDALITTQQ